MAHAQRTSKIKFCHQRNEAAITTNGLQLRVRGNSLFKHMITMAVQKSLVGFHFVLAILQWASHPIKEIFRNTKSRALQTNPTICLANPATVQYCRSVRRLQDTLTRCFTIFRIYTTVADLSTRLVVRVPASRASPPRHKNQASYYQQNIHNCPSSFNETVCTYFS